MKKLTKKEYLARKAAIGIVVSKLEESLNALESSGQYDSMNLIHDAIYSLGQDAKSLESDWNTRNWTTADWATYSLVANNID